MSDSEGETVVALAPKSKVKKARTPAQISATKKALEALQAKRKENWEVKKKELKTINKAGQALGEAKEPKEEKPKEEKPKESKIETVGNIVVSGGPIDHARGRAKPEDDMPEWAKSLNDKVDKVLKKKKKVVIEESESEDEVVIVKKKKKDDTPPPPPPAPVAPAKPENPLRRMLYRN